MREHRPGRPRTSWSRTITGLTAVLTAAVLSSCSPEGGIELGQATSAQRTDPCSLLGPADIDDVLGWQLDDAVRPTADESDGQAICSWENPRSGLVQVQVHEGAGRELFEQRREELEAIGESHDAEVGGTDGAWDDPSRGIVGFLVGEHFVQVAAWGGPMDDAQHLELAEVVAARL